MNLFLQMFVLTQNLIGYAMLYFCSIILLMGRICHILGGFYHILLHVYFYEKTAVPLFAEHEDSTYGRDQTACINPEINHWLCIQ